MLQGLDLCKRNIRVCQCSMSLVDIWAETCDCGSLHRIACLVSCTVRLLWQITLLVGHEVVALCKSEVLKVHSLAPSNCPSTDDVSRTICKAMLHRVSMTPRSDKGSVGNRDRLKVQSTA